MTAWRGWSSSVCAVTVALAVSCSRREAPPAPADAAPFTIVFGNACPDADVCAAGCDAGDAEQCRRLGDTLQFAQDAGAQDGRAAAYYERSCALRDGAGCLSAGQVYEYHHGVAKDDAKAAGFYRASCDLHSVPGCANLAIMLENGRGVPTDVAAAVVLYRTACTAGVSLACERVRSLAGDAAR
jgi:TPR repeat protein